MKRLITVKNIKMSRKKVIEIYFDKEPETQLKLDIISICSRIVSGLKSGEHVCIHSFNWGNKGNTFTFKKVSGGIISFFTKLKFNFVDENEEKRIIQELKLYLTNTTPKGITWFIHEKSSVVSLN